MTVVIQPLKSLITDQVIKLLELDTVPVLGFVFSAASSNSPHLSHHSSSAGQTI